MVVAKDVRDAAAERAEGAGGDLGERDARGIAVRHDPLRVEAERALLRREARERDGDGARRPAAVDVAERRHAAQAVALVDLALAVELLRAHVVERRLRGLPVGARAAPFSSESPPRLQPAKTRTASATAANRAWSFMVRANRPRAPVTATPERMRGSRTGQRPVSASVGPPATVCNHCGALQSLPPGE